VFVLDKLAVLRKKSGLSQEKLADKAGLSQQTISKYERGILEPDIDTLIFFADYFEVTVDYLLDRPVADVYDEIWELRLFMHERPEMRKLFNASKKVNKEDIEKVIALMESLKTNRNA